MNKKIFAISIGSFISDQVTKILVDMFINMDELIPVIDNFFYLTRVNNTGAAFSILEGHTLLLSLVSLVAIVLVIFLKNDFVNNKRTNWAFGLILGGIVGNFSDRLFLGSVRDFLKFDIFGYSYPIFNIADAAIVIGVIILIYSMIRGDDKSGNSSKKFGELD